MATTWTKPLHAGSGRSVAQALRHMTNYGKNPDKTDQGRLVTCYGCDTETMAAEFLLARRQYTAITGRKQSKESDVILYHVEQSFPAGEVSADQANAIGQELAQALTKGHYAYIVNTHIDKAHTHNHIYIHAVSLDCTHKFRNFKDSAWALRRLSDRICLEHGLSIVESPQPSKNRKEKWRNDKPISQQEQLRWAIDDALAKSPQDFEDWVRLMEEQGYRAKRGKQLLFYVPGTKKGTRCNTLKGDYTEEAIRERIAGTRMVQARQWHKAAPAKQSDDVKFFIDIQSKIQAGKGASYERWAKVFNLKQAAKTLLYLQENELTSYEVLESKVVGVQSKLGAYDKEIRKLEVQMSENAKLQTHITNYSKTREVYANYRKAGYSKAYLSAYEQDIQLHKAAKQAFDTLGKKIPSIASLRNEYGALLKQKQQLYAQKKSSRKEAQELLTAKANVDLILGKPSLLEKLEAAKADVKTTAASRNREEQNR